MEGPLPVVMECYEDVFEEIANKFYASDPLPKPHYGNPADVARLNSRLWPNGPSLAQSMIGMPLYPGGTAGTAPLLAANRAMSIASSSGGGGVANVSGGVGSSGAVSAAAQAAGQSGGPSNSLDTHNEGRPAPGGGGGGRGHGHGSKKSKGGGRGGGNNPGKDMWIENKETLSWANSKVAAYNPNTKMFKCTDCDTVGFLSRIAEHWLGSHANIKVFQCPRCPYSSAWARCVRMHMTRHHNEQHTDLTLWKDNPMLDEVAKLLQNLKNKVENKEPGDIDKKYACPHCPYATDRKDLFTRHENIHRDDKPFHCYVCYKMFNRADHVKKHFYRIHKDHVYDINLIRRHPPKSPYTSSNANSSNAASNYSKQQQQQHHHHHHHHHHQGQQPQQQHHPEPPAPPPPPPPPPQSSSSSAASVAAAAAAVAAAAAHLDNGLDGSGGGGGGGGGAGGSGKSKSKKRLPRMFVCTYCSWRGVDNWCLKRHLNTHIKPFLCVLCDYKAARAERLTTHVFKVHNKRICSKCGFLTEELSTLTAHMQQSHGRSHDGVGGQQPMHKCDRCGETFDVRPELEAHCILTHNSDLLDCDRCDFRTSNLSSLEQHRVERHSHEGPVTAYVPIVSKHHHHNQQQHHPHHQQHQQQQVASTALREVRCRECGCEFADHSSLQTHFLLLHKSERVPTGPGSTTTTNDNTMTTTTSEYSCSMCHLTANSQHAMMEHMRIHTGQVLACMAEECVFKTPYDSVLKEHVRYAHNDDFVVRCPHCGQSISSRLSLERHHLSHHHVLCSFCLVLVQKHFIDPSTTVGGNTTASLSTLTARNELLLLRRQRKQTQPKKLPKRRRGSTLRWRNKRSGRRWWSKKGARMRCWMCNPPKLFVLQSNYSTHLMWRHWRRRFNCGYCSAVFNRQHQVTLHRNRCHLATRKEGHIV